MNQRVLERVRQSLAAKQQALEAWMGSSAPDKIQVALGSADTSALDRHLAVIEASLKQAEAGTLGICTECHEPVEPELIQMDYTCCVCLTHLSDAERRSLESELELAQTVQQSLLPQSVPSVPGVEMAAFSRPAQIVGGDYFDFFPFADNRQGMVISDVAGHGMASSLIMASLQTMLRTLSQDLSHPGELVARINHLCLHNIQFTTFITLFAGAYEPETRRLVFCNAGHNPPILVRTSSRGHDLLNPSGPALGLAEESTYAEETITAQPGDLLFMYTDGVTECSSPDGDLFGSGRLVDVLKAQADSPVPDVLQAVRAELEAFSAGAPLEDDVTMVAWKFTAG
jgi:sigma-B regulation protein RsbU (phosphoserine phosphatase)